MEAPYEDDTPIFSPASTTLSIDPSSYLSVPGPGPVRNTHRLTATPSFEEELDRFFSTAIAVSNDSLPQIIQPENPPTRQLSPSPNVVANPEASQLFSSASSVGSVNPITRYFSYPPARTYCVPSFQKMSTSRSTITAVSIFLSVTKVSLFTEGVHQHESRFQNTDRLKAEKERMIQALNTHRINTLSELRRTEKAFAKLGSPDVAAPMTAACESRLCLQVQATYIIYRVLLCQLSRSAD